MLTQELLIVQRRSTTVCYKASATGISTFYNYFNQFHDYLIEISVSLAFWLTVIPIHITHVQLRSFGIIIFKPDKSVTIDTHVIFFDKTVFFSSKKPLFHLSHNWGSLFLRVASDLKWSSYQVLDKLTEKIYILNNWISKPFKKCIL